MSDNFVAPVVAATPVSAFSVRVFDRSWGRINLPAGVAFAPQTWDANAIGGPSAAEVRATGDLKRLHELIEWTGYKMYIMSPDNEYVWWGHIEEIVPSGKNTNVGVTLEGVANRIKVLYTDDAPGGEMEPAETDWAQDDASIALYGVRERQHSAPNPIRAEQAERMRDTLLGRVSSPFTVVGQLGPQDGASMVTLRCVGYWQRLSRIYYANDNGLTEYTDGGTLWPLGLGFTSTNVAFSSRDGNYSIHQLFARFTNFGRAPSLRVSVVGSSLNDGIYTVTAANDKEAESLTATTIRFDLDDDIIDSNRGLGFIEAGDIIQVSGSVHNSGTHLVKTPGLQDVEISPGYAGAPGPPDNIVNESAGPSITIQRGNNIEVEQSVVNEHTGPSVTVTAHGERIAQGFYTGTSGDWVLASVELKIRKVGAPTDGIYVRLRADSGGAPTGSILDSAFLDDADISDDEQGRWVTFAYSGGVLLDNSTLYWLEILRSSSNDSADYYEIAVDENGGYPSAGSLLYTGSAYVSPLNPLSVLFRLKGAVDTALQVQAICEAAGVFVAVQVQPSEYSGLLTCQYRDGSLFASDEAAELLDTGDGSNLRLIATINPDRWGTIRKQPVKTTAQYLWRDGALFTLQGRPVTPGALPVGEWCVIDNPVLLQGALASASPFFIEYASYTADQGWSLRAAGEPDPWRIGETLDG